MRQSYLEMCRVYLAATRLLSVRIPEPVQKLIEEDLVQARRRFPSLTVSSEKYSSSLLCLHSALILHSLMTCMCG